MFRMHGSKVSQASLTWSIVKFTCTAKVGLKEREHDVTCKNSATQNSVVVSSTHMAIMAHGVALDNS